MHLLKVVSGQKPREIAAEVLNRAKVGRVCPRRAADLLATANGAPGTDAPCLGPVEARRRKFVEDLLDTALSRAQLPPADRRLCQELVYGVVRW